MPEQEDAFIGRSSHCAVHPEIMKGRIIINANPAANIVLVHGGFVDGSGWRPVYDLLTRDGYHVAVVQNPTLSLQGDVAATRLIIDAQDGPVVLVGHSYGGAVITEAGTGQKVGQHAPRRYPGRRAAAADPASQGRLPVPVASAL
jgi:pimeloyl-ACP methyl ester carboxylesterase